MKNKPKPQSKLAEFDLELAKQGYPVCTRDHRHEIRIVCFDAKNEFPIIALMKSNTTLSVYEHLVLYTAKGKSVNNHNSAEDNWDDLMLICETSKEVKQKPTTKEWMSLDEIQKVLCEHESRIQRLERKAESLSNQVFNY